MAYAIITQDKKVHIKKRMCKVLVAFAYFRIMKTGIYVITKQTNVLITLKCGDIIIEPGGLNQSLN
jgi:hypothetical protein